MSDESAVFQTLTADERRALSGAVNLADAHTYQPMTLTEQSEILAQFAELFTKSIQRDYWELEASAAWAFGTSLGQSVVDNLVVATYASSISTMIVARALKRLGRDLSLTVPTFDNVHALLVGEGLEVTPRPLDVPLLAWIQQHKDRQVFFEVSPNNPTGHFIGQADLEGIAVECAARGHLLVLDQSFKAHDERACFDYYGVFERAGAEYVVIEDTGKLWPVRDLKVSFIHASAEMHHILRDVADDVLLNVAPFILGLVETYAKYSSRLHYRNVRDVIGSNRALLRRMVTETPALRVPFADSRVAVEVLAAAVAPADVIVRELSGQGLHVLNCAKFYWGGQPLPGAQLRVALARPTEAMKAGIEILRAYLPTSRHGR